MSAAARLTRNNRSVQVVIPASLRAKYALKAGDAVEFEAIEAGILIRARKVPEITTTVFSVGYEGETIDGFLKRLKTAGVKQLVDVREIPLSRKKGFSKTALGLSLEQQGIEYHHIPELGSPSGLRQDYKDGETGLTEFKQKYAGHVAKHRKAFELLRGIVMTKPTAMMCFEKAHWACHRDVLSAQLEEKGFKVRHL